MPNFRVLRRCLAASLFFFLGPALAGAATSDEKFAKPDRIHYDSHCLTIDGKDTFVFSGAFHYFRCPKPLWHDRFQKIKDAGFNAVETYVAWNAQEPEMPSGLNDFSKVDLRDVDDWLKMAEEFGLYVIIRPGPYICAEWDRGGLPNWLITKRPEHPKRSVAWLRTDDPEFIAWSKHWYVAVCKVVAPHQITHKAPGQPGVILFQIENEYDYSRLSEEIQAAYVKAMSEVAMADGIDVPLFTCWTKCVRGSSDPVNSRLFDSCNFYPGWGIDRTANDMRTLRNAQPQAPLMTTELQGGWFTGINEEPPIYPDRDHYRADLVPAQINNLTLFTIEHGETMLNYYMLFGGTNFADMAGHNIATCYDYSSPIRECGGVGDKYERVKAIGQMLREHGAKLTRAESVQCDAKTGDKDVTVTERRAKDGGRYLFVRTNQHNQPRKGTASVKEQGADAAELSFDYELEPFGSKILYLEPGVTDASKGQWLPKEPPAIQRPADLRAGSVKISDAKSATLPLPTAWKPVKEGQHLADLGIYDNRFVYYRTAVTLSADDLKTAGGLHLQTDCPKEDRLAVLVNGQLIAPSGTTGDDFNVQPAARAGENEIIVLYENTAAPNFGPTINKNPGVTGLKLVPGGGNQSLANWRMQRVDRAADAEKLEEVAEDFDDSGWSKTQVNRLEASQLQANQAAVFRTSIEVNDDQLFTAPTMLQFSRIDDEGWVFVNGHKVGEAHAWDEAFYFDANEHLHAGKNTIAVVVRNKDGAGGLGTVALTSADRAGIGKVGPLSYATTEPVSKLPQMSSASLTGDAPSVLGVHRVTFELPEADKKVWLPWLIRMHATGNGFVYLNGHALGRFWQTGKQTDYYMPECWLNFGPGKKNEVTLLLRTVDKPAAIESAEAIPYTVYAESR